MSAETSRLSAALEAKLLDRLRHEWHAINYTYFKEALRAPLLQLADSRRRLGQWHADRRTIEVSRSLVLEYPWTEVMEVLKHEVAHQYVDERLDVDETAHGPSFRQVCARLGIDASATGSPSRELGEDRDDPAHRVVQRIRKLLALAQSPNQHEAETAATAARKLMLKFNVEVEGPRADSRDPSHDGRRYGYRHLGRPSGRIYEHERRLARILTDYFFVEGIWLPVYRPHDGKRGSVLEICGLEHNLLMAEHVHAFLGATALRLWADYRREHGGGSNRDRQAFLAGVMRGFEAKLAAQDRGFEEQGLVWVPAPELDAYFRRRYPRVHTERRRGARRNEAFASGREAGREIVLSQPVESTGASGRPKALRRGS